MDDSVPTSQFRLTKLGWTWLVLLGFGWVAGWILQWFDHSTELIPDHSDALEFSFMAASVVSVVSAALIFWQSQGAVLARVVMSLLVAPLLGFLGVLVLLSELMIWVASRDHFPPGRTRTFEGMLLVKRAYQTHGRGRSWNIQTTPIWSNLEITEADYKFMLARRAPGDPGRDQDEISSNAHFCANVMLQQSEQALRVLHAGAYKLPRGTIGVCSEITAKNPTITVVR